VNNITSLLTAILNKAKEKGHLKSVPKFKKYAIDNARDRFLTWDEIDVLYEAIENSNLPTKDRLLLFVKVALSTGARLGTILGIRGKDINRTRQSVLLQDYKNGSTYTGYLQDEVMVLIPPLEPQQKLIDVSSERQIQRVCKAFLISYSIKGSMQKMVSIR